MARPRPRRLGDAGPRRRSVGGPQHLGRWTATNASGSVGVMEYRTDGTWKLTGDGTVVSSGTYTADSSTITFSTDAYCKTQNAEQGTYAWTHGNDQLILTKQTDSCANRIRDLEGRVWKPAT